MATNPRSSTLAAFKSRLVAATAVGQPLAGWSVESSRIDRVDDAQTGVAFQKRILLYAPRSEGAAVQAGYRHTYASGDAVTVNVLSVLSGADAAAVETALGTHEDTLRTLLLGDQTLLDLFADHPDLSVATAVYEASSRILGDLLLTFVCNVPFVEVP